MLQPSLWPGAGVLMVTASTRPRWSHRMAAAAPCLIFPRQAATNTHSQVGLLIINVDSRMILFLCLVQDWQRVGDTSPRPPATPWLPASGSSQPHWSWRGLTMCLGALRMEPSWWEGVEMQGRHRNASIIRIQTILPASICNTTQCMQFMFCHKIVKLPLYTLHMQIAALKLSIC